MDAIFLMYRDLRELDPLLAWMTPEREHLADRMKIPQQKSLVVASALFALVFRAPQHPRIGHWRERAQKLVEVNPTTDLGARLTAGLLIDYTWRGDLAEAELLWRRFEARAERTELSPMMKTIRQVNTATLHLHQGRLLECREAVRAGLAVSAQGGVRIWDGVLHCHGAAASLSHGAIEDARTHLAAIEQLFADGIPADEAYYRAMLDWYGFVSGDAVGVVSRSESSLAHADQKGVAYFMAVARMSSGLVHFEAGLRERGRALLLEGLAIGVAISNPVVAWIGDLFTAHMDYAEGDAVRGDAKLHSALRLGRDRALVHFFAWPREIVARLVDRGLDLGYATDYLARLIAIYGFTPGDAPARSDRWKFSLRIYCFGEPRIVHDDGRVEHLSVQRQIELLASLIGKHGKPTAKQVVAAEVYGDDEVDPANSLKRVLHTLKSRLGKAITRERGLLALDFSTVWIDAASLLQQMRDGASTTETLAWLDQHYHGNFMDKARDTIVVAQLRRRLRKHAERVIRDSCAHAVETRDDALVRKLELRWRHLFPALFEPIRR